ncbi:hypothetical protein NBRC116589_13440 [Ruegeria sp. HU-ET01832]|uniref:hypothetical protein n=1 Tax=Ruegeria sp. HU-ET01832 TaxID=3135906 RepID=UPI00310598D4
MHLRTKHEIATLFVLAEKTIDHNGKRGFFGKDKGAEAASLMIDQLDRVVKIALQNGDLEEAKFTEIMNLIKRGTEHARIRDDASHVLSRVIANKCGFDFDQLLEHKKSEETKRIAEEIEDAFDNLVEFALALSDGDKKRIEYWGEQRNSSYDTLYRYNVEEKEIERRVAEELASAQEAIRLENETRRALRTLTYARMELQANDLDTSTNGQIEALRLLRENGVTGRELEEKIQETREAVVSAARGVLEDFDAETVIDDAIFDIAYVEYGKKTNQQLDEQDYKDVITAVETLRRLNVSEQEAKLRTEAEVEKLMSDDAQKAAVRESEIKAEREKFDASALVLATHRRAVQTANRTLPSHERVKPGPETDVQTPEGREAREHLLEYFTPEQVEKLIEVQSGELWYSEALENARKSQEEYWGTSAHEASELTREQISDMRSVGHFPPQPEGFPLIATSVDFCFYIDPSKTRKPIKSCPN